MRGRMAKEVISGCKLASGTSADLRLRSQWWYDHLRGKGVGGLILAPSRDGAANHGYRMSTVLLLLYPLCVRYVLSRR